ncbi:MAG: PAS domain S-box protein, partial [Deltaproteobacteria bacterium]|nr:PAS domain S-box protein [Deltaproteobacteria bacterium]
FTDLLPILLFEVDPAGNIASYNRTALEAFRYNEDDYKEGMSALQFFAPEERQRVEENIRKVMQGTPITGQEFTFLRKDGSTFIGLLYASPHIRQNETAGIRGAIIDITARKRTEKALQELASRDEAILASIPDIIMEVDNNKIYTWANQAGREFFGEGVIGKEAAFYFEGVQETYNVVSPLFMGSEDTIYVESRQRRRDGEKRLLAWWCRVLKDAQGNVTGALSSARDITERERAREEMALLATIGRVIGSTLEIEKIYERVAAEIRTMIPFDSLVVNLFNAKKETLSVAYVSGLVIPGRTIGDTFSARGTPAEEAFRTREGMIVRSENPQELIDKYPSLLVSVRAGMHSVMLVPLTANDQAIGILIMRSKKPDAYGEQELQLAEKIGMQIAGAIANAGLFHERKQVEKELQKTLESLRKAFGTIIQVMVSAVETRDPYTAGHQTRSADLARAIATELGLPPEKIDGIRMAGVIHDIGKLSIPAEILSKPTKLSEIEFMLIREHARQGYELLKNVESPWPLAEIVYQHHERMDGSGYPRNLKGDAILIEARIIAVSDVVEAMASHRPYRPGFGIEAALNEIEHNRGTLYDAPAADACLRLFREKGYQLAGT